MLFNISIQFEFIFISVLEISVLTVNMLQLGGKASFLIFVQLFFYVICMFFLFFQLTMFCNTFNFQLTALIYTTFPFNYVTIKGKSSNLNQNRMQLNVYSLVLRKQESAHSLVASHVLETKTNKRKFNKYIKLGNICCTGLLTSQSL